MVSKLYAKLLTQTILLRYDFSCSSIVSTNISLGNNVIGNQMGLMNGIKIKVRKIRDWRHNIAVDCLVAYQNKVI